jgi:hypothetical protein
MMSKEKAAATTSTSGQQVLQPYKPVNTRKEYSILVEVSSRDRNYLQRVASNPMRYQFARPVKDIRCVELISGTIPANPYNIVQGANSFTLQEGTSTQFTITLTPGVYTASSLITELNTKTSALSTSNTYTWSQNTVTGSSILNRTAGSTTFALLFLSGLQPDVIDHSDGYFLQQVTPALQLGFDMSDYYQTSGAITSPFPMDLHTSTNRIYLYINLENSLDLGAIERGAGRRWPFAIIYLDQQTNGYKFLNKDTITPISFSLPQPFSRLQNLQIEFRDEWYRLIDFNGKDFSLLLQLTALE